MVDRRVTKFIGTKHDSVQQCLPQNGWLGTYLHFTEGTEICPRFRFFSAACSAGAAVSNRVWIQRGDPGLLPKLFPNPWVLLLAPPGRGHKTTAINMASNCLQQACEEVRILADKLTPESLVKALAAPLTKKDIIRIGPRDATGLIKAPELSVFFGKQQYNTGMVSLITALYDYSERWTNSTIGRGGESLYNNCLSVLGGSTPAWLQQMLPQDAFTGGFMSRFIIVEMPPNYYKKVTHPKKPKDLIWKDLVEGLRQFSQMSGEMEWTEGSLVEYDRVDSSLTPTGDPQEDAYRERESEQILKIAMLLALNEGLLYLEGPHVVHAEKIVRALQTETGPRIERLTTHPRMQIVQEVQDLLKLYGELSEGELLHKVYRMLSQGERQFYEALSVLKRTGTIDVIGKMGDYSFKLKGEKNDKLG